MVERTLPVHLLHPTVETKYMSEKYPSEEERRKERENPSILRSTMSIVFYLISADWIRCEYYARRRRLQWITR